MSRQFWDDVLSGLLSAVVLFVIMFSPAAQRSPVLLRMCQAQLSDSADNMQSEC